MSRSSRSIACAAALGLVGTCSVFQGATPALADERTVTFKPLAGFSLDVGSKRVVGYYQADAGECALTLMIADAMIGDDVPAFAPVRLYQSVAPGDTATVDAPEGKSLQVICKIAARAMTARVLNNVAIYKPAR
jgi:hypothetical protein